MYKEHAAPDAAGHREPAAGNAESPVSERHELPLEDAVRFAMEEARIILPGIQALFGFQLIVVFNDRFAEIFEAPGQILHVTALVLVALSCALTMTPAAVHRHARRCVSPELLALSSRFLAAAMVPLLLAISIDVGLVVHAVTHSIVISMVLGVCCAVGFVLLWIVFPRVHSRRLRA